MKIVQDCAALAAHFAEEAAKLEAEGKRAAAEEALFQAHAWKAFDRKEVNHATLN
jgi:hypothetical protein